MWPVHSAGDIAIRAVTAVESADWVPVHGPREVRLDAVEEGFVEALVGHPIEIVRKDGVELCCGAGGGLVGGETEGFGSGDDALAGIAGEHVAEHYRVGDVWHVVFDDFSVGQRKRNGL